MSALAALALGAALVTSPVPPAKPAPPAGQAAPAAPEARAEAADAELQDLLQDVRRALGREEGGAEAPAAATTEPAAPAETPPADEEEPAPAAATPEPAAGITDPVSAAPLASPLPAARAALPDIPVLPADGTGQGAAEPVPAAGQNAETGGSDAPTVEPTGQPGEPAQEAVDPPPAPLPPLPPPEEISGRNPRRTGGPIGLAAVGSRPHPAASAPAAEPEAAGASRRDGQPPPRPTVWSDLRPARVSEATATLPGASRVVAEAGTAVASVARAERLSLALPANPVPGRLAAKRSAAAPASIAAEPPEKPAAAAAPAAEQTRPARPTMATEVTAQGRSDSGADAAGNGGRVAPLAMPLPPRSPERAAPGDVMTGNAAQRDAATGAPVRAAGGTEGPGSAVPGGSERRKEAAPLATRLPPASPRVAAPDAGTPTTEQPAPPPARVSILAPDGPNTIQPPTQPEREAPQMAPRPRPSMRLETPKQLVCRDPRLSGTPIPQIVHATWPCGIAQPVRINAISGIRLSSPVTLDCNTASRLASWLTGVANLAAREHLQSEIARVWVMGSYACRTRNNRPAGKLSEHARGRAVDVGGVWLNDGRKITLAGHWGKGSEGRFLKQIRGRACGLFHTVLGPGSDRHHADHLHLDTSPRGGEPYCK